MQRYVITPVVSLRMRVFDFDAGVRCILRTARVAHAACAQEALGNRGSTRGRSRDARWRDEVFVSTNSKRNILQALA